LRQRLAPLLLFAGLAAGSAYLSRHTPRETEVVFRLDGDRDTLRSVNASFAKPGGEAAAGSQWTFAAGAPLTVRTKVNLPAGLYDIAITLERTNGYRENSSRNVELKGEPVTIPVKVVWPPSSTAPAGP
jgi:hypothetical protein